MKWPELGELPNIGGLKYAAPSHDDFSATVYYAWDADFLYMGISITHDLIYDGVAEAFKLPDDDDHILWGLSPFAPSYAAAGTTDWTNGIGEATGPSAAAGFESVTNTVPTDVNKRFMRLEVELAE